MIEWLERAPKERPKDDDIVKDLSQYWVCCPHCGRKGSFGGEISRKNIRIRTESYKGLWYAYIFSTNLSTKGTFATTMRTAYPIL